MVIAIITMNRSADLFPLVSIRRPIPAGQPSDVTKPTPRRGVSSGLLGRHPESLGLLPAISRWPAGHLGERLGEVALRGGGSAE